MLQKLNYLLLKMVGHNLISDGMKGSCTSSEKENNLVTSFIKTYVRHKNIQMFSRRKIASTQRYEYGVLKRLFLRLHTIYPKQHLSYVKFRKMYYSILVVESSKLKIVSELSHLRNAYMCTKLCENSYSDVIHRNNTPLSKHFSIDCKPVTDENEQNETVTMNPIGKTECENKVVMKLDIEDDSVLIIQNKSDSESDTEQESKIEKLEYCVDNAVMDADSTFSEAPMSVKNKRPTYIKQAFLNPPILLPCHCARKCYMKFTKQHRTKIHTNFWSIPSYQGQKKWMLKHICPVISDKPHYQHYKITNKVQYFLEDELNYLVPVCVVYFLRILGLGKFTMQHHSEETSRSQEINNCHSFLKGDDLNCGDEDSITKPQTNFRVRKFKVSKRFSVKNLYTHFVTTYPSCPVSFNKYSVLYRQIKSAEKNHDLCTRNENNFCVTSFNERIKNSIQKMQVDSANELSPKIRRSARQTKMRGSMAEDDLLQQDHESLSFSALAPTPKCKVKKCHNLDADNLVQSNSGLASPSPTEEAFHSQTGKGRNKRRGRLTAHTVLSVKSSQAQRSAKNSGNKLIPKHCALAPLMKKYRHPILPSCNCSRRKCIEKISEERRHAIHQMFWDFHSYKERKQWLMKYVEKIPSKNKLLSLAPLQHKKHISKKYYFPNGSSGTVEVCRLFFIHTLGFRWDSVVDTIAKAKQPVQIDRKKHSLFKKSVRQLPEHIIMSVKDYLESVRLSLGILKVSAQNEMIEPHIDDLPGLKSKDLFADYKKKHKHLKFNLGYHSFRRIFQNFVDPESMPNAELESESDAANVENLPSKTIADTTENYIEVKNQFNQVIPKSDGTLKTIFKHISIKTKKKTYKKSKVNNRKDNQNSTGDTLCFKENSDEVNVPDSIADSKDAINSRCKQDVDDVILDVGSGIFKPSTSVDDNLNGTLYCADLKYKKRRSHSNRNNGEFYPVLPPCKCAKRKCSEKFSESQRLHINKSFWDLDGYNERKQWILEHIKRADIKRRKVAAHDSTHRKLESRWYYLPDEKGEQMDVCKAFFLRTLGYKWDSVIDTIGKTTPKGEKIVAPDRRGRKPPSHKISEDALNSMTRYIESACQTYQSLYQQKSLNQKKGNNLNPAGLIPYGLTMKQLFEDYKTKHPNHKFGYESFRKVFKHVHSEVLSNLPQVPESDELPEPSASVAPLTTEHDYSGLSSAEDFTKTQEFVASAVSASLPYPDVNSCQPIPPLPPAPFFHVHTNPVPEPRSCLYQYPQQPNTQLSKCAQLEHDHSNFTEQELFMKYPVNIYGAAPSLSIPPNNLTQVSEQVNYKYTINSHVEMVDVPYSTNQNQLPPYLIANHEPLKHQVYQMASQYQSILHHISESSRFFNYRGFPTTEASTPSAQIKTPLYGNSQQYTRECIDTFVPEAPQKFSSSVLPAQYNLPCQDTKNCQSNSLSILTSCSNNVFCQENEQSGNFSINKDPTQIDSDMVDRNNSQNQGSGKKKETLKVKKEKRARSKSDRNYGDHYPMLPPCNCKKKKCTDKFSDLTRQRIHELFWDLKNYNERKQWMLLHIKREDCKRRRVDQPESTRKSESRWYYFPDEDGKLIEVCKDFFLRTLGYKWDSVIDTIRKTTPKGDKSTQPDMRGKKTPSHKLSNEVLCSVVQYIKSMQQTAQLKSGLVQETDSSFEKDRQENRKSPKHRCNNISAGNTSVPYGLTMKDLFDDYKVKHASHKIGYESFRRIFKAISNSEKFLEEKIQEGYSNDVGILSF